MAGNLSATVLFTLWDFSGIMRLEWQRMTPYLLCVCDWLEEENPKLSPHIIPTQLQHSEVQDCLYSPSQEAWLLPLLILICHWPHPVSAADANSQVKWGHLFNWRTAATTLTKELRTQEGPLWQSQGEQNWTPGAKLDVPDVQGSLGYLCFRETPTAGSSNL